MVYRAEDIRLHRLVPLKFLSGELAHDPAALERFRGRIIPQSWINLLKVLPENRKCLFMLGIPGIEGG